MKKIISAMLLLILFSGCTGFFESAEKTTTIEIKKETISTELAYEGKLTKKGESIQDCSEEIKKIFPSVQASLEANINSLDQNKRETAKAELIFLQEAENSMECRMESFELSPGNHHGKMTLSFENSIGTIKKLGELAGEFSFTDINKEHYIIFINPETPEYFSSELTSENLKIKIKGEIIEVLPERYSLKDGYIIFYNTQDLNADSIRIEFRKEKPEEFPVFLIAAGFIILTAAGVIIFVWKKRNPEELFPHSEEEIKDKMKKELINGLGTTEIEILNFEKNALGYEAEVMIKIRKYHVVFNSKMELKNYLKIE